MPPRKRTVPVKACKHKTFERVSDRDNLWTCAQCKYTVKLAVDVQPKAKGE